MDYELWIMDFFSKEEIEIQAKLAGQSKAEIATSLNMLKGAIMV